MSNDFAATLQALQQGLAVNSATLQALKGRGAPSQPGLPEYMVGAIREMIRQEVTSFKPAEAVVGRIGEALSEERKQLLVKNLQKLDGFLAADEGKAVILLFMDEFEAFLKEA